MTAVYKERKAPRKPFAVYRKALVMSVHDDKASAEKAAQYVSPYFGAGVVMERKQKDNKK